MHLLRLVPALLLLASAAFARSDDFGSLCADRAAVERVYHSHRLETRQTFEEAMSAALIERLVHLDQQKEERLRSVYGVTITDAEVSAEVQRIDATTRAPETRAELKAALDNNPARFARIVARPIVVERTLRARFENDDALHAIHRQEAEKARGTALAARKDGVEKQSAALTDARAEGQVNEATWQLGARPAEDQPAATPPTPPPAAKGTASSHSYTVEATARFTQTLSNPTANGDGSAAERRFYFEDLEPELQKVLRVQLRKPGDVSAVVETPGAFLVFIAEAHDTETLRVAALLLPKLSYEEWLAAQSAQTP